MDLKSIIGGCGSLLMLALCAPLPALASLGGMADSVQADQARMKASGRMLPSAGKYTIHELQMPSGTVVREFAGLDGRIFAVAWQGPVKPDMNQLLGAYFQQYREQSAGAAASRRQMQIRGPGLVLQSHGRLRAFTGRAYLPQYLPDGVSVEEIQ